MLGEFFGPIASPMGFVDVVFYLSFHSGFCQCHVLFYRSCDFFCDKTSIMVGFHRHRERMLQYLMFKAAWPNRLHSHNRPHGHNRLHSHNKQAAWPHQAAWLVRLNVSLDLSGHAHKFPKTQAEWLSDLHHKADATSSEMSSFFL